MRRAALAVLIAAVAGAAVFSVSNRGEAGCPSRSGPEAKRVADSFVSALIRQDGDDAMKYVSSDAEAMRADMPGASANPDSTAHVLSRAKRSTVETCSQGYLRLVGAPQNDPCFVYDIETFGGGWLSAGRKMFPVHDFRVLMGCDGGEWRVKGTVRIQ
jgi:hypothetical protein